MRGPSILKATATKVLFCEREYEDAVRFQLMDDVFCNDLSVPSAVACMREAS